jgi:ActR/RegA family two-component response regulator
MPVQHRNPAHTVLIVDDDHSVRWLLAVAFQRRGLEVDVAESGKEALNLLRRNGPQYCAIVLDLDIPPPDGVTIAERVREMELDTSLVILSGHPELVDRVREKGLAESATLILSKPASIDTIVDQVHGICGRP